MWLRNISRKFPLANRKFNEPHAAGWNCRKFHAVLADDDMCDDDATLHVDQVIALRRNDHQGRSVGTQ
jgi:hypothetical protein